MGKPSKTIKDHGKTIKDHGKTIKDHGKTIKKHGKTIKHHQRPWKSHGKNLPTHPTRGEDWFTTERFWDSAAAYDPVLAPTMVTPFVGGAPGTWEDLRPPSRCRWGGLVEPPTLWRIYG